MEPWQMLLLALMILPARADMYLNNPRGSNNKLREQSNNVQNANRLFDSQNNAASGYQIGDDCKPACKDGNNNYDVTKEGATKGTMKFYQGSELYIEWHHQHGCGVGHPNVKCQIILQYMSESDNVNLRDGTGQDSAGGDDNDPTEAGTAEPARGYHEPLEFYEACAQRQRNEGLYTADQNLESNGGATSTRQNPNGNGRRRGQQRHGLECPEERDYYPYWHPSVWHDIAILTDEPETRCAYYQMESQNVKAKHICSIPAHNNRDACESNDGEWQEVAPFNEPAPECLGGIQSRDNHNGNVRNGGSAFRMGAPKVAKHSKELEGLTAKMETEENKAKNLEEASAALNCLVDAAKAAVEKAAMEKAAAEKAAAEKAEKEAAEKAAAEAKAEAEKQAAAAATPTAEAPNVTEAVMAAPAEAMAPEDLEPPAKRMRTQEDDEPSKEAKLEAQVASPARVRVSIG